MLDVELKRPDRPWMDHEEAALQSGIQELEDELSGAGVDDATMRLRVRSVREGLADVHAELWVGGRAVASANAEDPDLVEALRRTLTSMTQSVESVAQRLAATPKLTQERTHKPVHPAPGMVVPWRMVEDHLHRYALHALLQRVLAGDLPAGHVDGRDIAEAVLSERLQAGPVTDLFLVLDDLRDAVEEALDREVAEVADEAGNVSTDRLQTAPDLDADLDRSTERGLLTAALFSLNPEARHLFAEVVVDGFPVDAVAAARGLDTSDIELEVGSILMRLAERLGRSRQETWAAYEALGQVLQSERIDPRTPVTGG